MQQVMAYLASDGTLFRNSGRCLDYERGVEFKNAYENMALSGRLKQCTLGNASSVSAPELTKWLLANRGIVINLLRGEPNV